MLSSLLALSLGGLSLAPVSGQAPDSGEASVSAAVQEHLPQTGDQPQGDQDQAPVAEPGSVRRSVFGDVLHLGDEPPEARSLAVIQLLYSGCTGAPRDMNRDLDTTLVLANDLREQLAAGASFRELARRHSASNTAPTGGVLGSFPRGFLAPEFEEFLFSADTNQISEPVVGPTGVHVLKRVERFAGARVLAVRDGGPEGRERLVEIAGRIKAGEDFGVLAKEFSEDPLTADRGGALAVFERGRGDMLLKAAAFQAKVGELVGPIETPRGLYLVQRVDPDAIPPELHENPWIDLRGILLTYDSVTPPVQAYPRSFGESEALAQELIERIRSGEDMAELARQFDNDHGGQARAGRIGWIHRHQPGLASYWQALWRNPPGQIEGPVGLPIGHLIYRRER